MNLPVRREFQLVSGGSGLVENLEEADALIIALLLWSGEMKVGSIQPYAVSDVVVVSSALLLVVLHFHIVGGLFESIVSLFVDRRHGRSEFCGRRVREWGRSGRVR